MNASDDPWAAPVTFEQAEPATAPPPAAPTAQHSGEDPDPWSGASAPDPMGPGGHGPAAAGGATCYLLHFDRPYISANGKGVAAHYQGSALDLPARLAKHEQGQGARLLQVAKAAGITWRLARTWPGGRDRERQLKKQGGASRRCPDCGVTPRTPPAELKDTTAMKHPSRRDASPPPGTRPPEYVVEAWVSKQLRDRIPRTGAASAEATPEVERQPRERNSPQLEDMEAEP